MGKFDLQATKNPLTDRHQNLHIWLRRGYLPPCEILFHNLWPEMNGVVSLLEHDTYAVALDASLRILLLVAWHTDSLLVTWYERLHADWLTTNLAAETLLVKLLPFELVLLHPFNKSMSPVYCKQCDLQTYKSQYGHSLATTTTTTTSV